METKPAAGTIGWVDLTVQDAGKVMEFYREVAGWTPEPVEMGGYKDFSMLSSETGQPVAGVCHARGSNSGIPPVWMIYIIVTDLDRSLDRCRQLGGRQVGEIRNYGPNGRYAMIQDPAGAHVALFQPPAEPQVA